MKTSRIASIVLVLAAAPAPQALAQDTISATHVFPASLIYARSFLEFVKKANAASGGAFTINVRGGPEAIGMMEQPGAARSGVVDMVYTPCAFYAAAVPECDAVSASTIDGPTARKNGGLKLLDQVHQKRAGLALLGWVDSGIRFTLWSTRAPTLDASGHIDIKGYKVRGNPIYNAFLTNYLGAQVINIPATELYTALERGTVDLTAWTQIGIMDLNWDRYIKYRIGPGLFLDRPDDRRQPEEVEFALVEDPRHPGKGCGRARGSPACATCRRCAGKEEQELQKRGIKFLSQSDAASRSSSPARARRACSA
jgi:TRAP-type C4-dicarboxylate transport system substrate-binding protein